MSNIDYKSDLVFEQECAKIFWSSWLILGHKSEWPEIGSFKTVQILTESLLVTRSAQNKFECFFNICPHRGSIVEPELCGERAYFRCPYHGWEYGLNGRIQAIDSRRKFSDEEVHRCSLKKALLSEFEGYLFVCLGEPKESLEELMGPFRDEFRKNRTSELQARFYNWTNEIESNWKHLVENNLEGYHIKAAHPGLYEIYGEKYPLVAQGKLTKTKITLDVSAPKAPTDQMYMKLLNSRPDGLLRDDWVYITGFPSFTFELYPEQTVYFQYLPLTRTKSIVHGAYHALPTADRKLIGLQYLNRRIGRRTSYEDLFIAELMQRASQSKRFSEFAVSDEREKVVTHFQKLVLEHLA